MFRTKRVRLTRSLVLGGRHVDEGSIRNLAQPLADDLIAQGSAVHLNLFSQAFARIRQRKPVSAPSLPVEQREKRGTETVDKTEKAMELLERAKKLGLRLCMDFESGMNVLKTPASLDEEGFTFIRELATYLPEIRSILKKRAVVAVGSTLVGRRIVSKDYGEGTLESADENGALTISVCMERRRSYEDQVHLSRTSLSSGAESLLILDEAQTNTTSIPDDDTQPEPPKRGFLERLRRG